MAFSTANIFTGPANLYVDGKHVGYTKGGLRLRVNKSLWFRPSINNLGDIEGIKSSEEFYVSTVLIENTLELLKKAWSIDGDYTSPDGSNLYRRIDFGGKHNVLPVHSLKLIANQAQMMVVFHRVVAADFGEISFLKSQEASIPVTFRVLLDETKLDGQQLGYIVTGNKFDVNDLLCSLTITGKVRGRKSLVCRVKTD